MKGTNAGLYKGETHAWELLYPFFQAQVGQGKQTKVGSLARAPADNSPPLIGMVLLAGDIDIRRGGMVNDALGAVGNVVEAG
jgi:hypothetical protein